MKTGSNLSKDSSIVTRSTDLDWEALARKEVTPPFKPVIESDESTSNFDPEFTSADISHVGLVNELNLDDDDPSEDWRSSTGAIDYAWDPDPAKTTRDLTSSPPLTSSVQENFRGFTYSGESVLITRVVNRLAEKEGREAAVADEEVTYPTTAVMMKHWMRARTLAAIPSAADTSTILRKI
ncbi:kinase C terminal domain-containing protein [Russula emetica]|nr:kinase C terminal domain-containing protein [Russula emetica]